MFKNVVVTGASGMIGSNLANSLLELGANVYNFDNLSSGSHNGTLESNFRYCDISNREKLYKLLDVVKPEIIFHCAAHFANQNSVDFPISDVNDNVIGLINILEYAKNDKIKVVYCSSSCVYGNANSEMSVGDCIEPYETPYAINKYVGELYCKFYNNLYGVKVNILRIFNTYGPGELPGVYRNVIPNFFLNASRNEDVIITGNGSETRDFTYVSDTVNLLIKMAQSEYWEAEVFNGGTGVPTMIEDLARKIIYISGSQSNICYTCKRKWDDINSRVSDTSKSVAMLGYKPRFDIDSGLKLTWDWLKPYLTK